MPQEREEYEYSKKGEGEGNTIDKLGTSTKERTQGASSPSSASNYAPWPLVALSPPLDEDDILGGREVIVAGLTHSLWGIISAHVAAWRKESDCGPHMEDSHENVPPLLPFMPEACGRRTYSTQRVGFLPKPKRWIHMSTAHARRIRFLLCILHCTVDSQKTDCGSSFSGKYGKDEKGGQTDQLGAENTKLIRRRKNIGWETK